MRETPGASRRDHTTKGTMPYIIFHFNQSAHQPSQASECKSFKQFRRSLTRLSGQGFGEPLLKRSTKSPAELWEHPHFHTDRILNHSLAATTRDLVQIGFLRKPEPSSPQHCTGKLPAEKGHTKRPGSCRLHTAPRARQTTKWREREDPRFEKEAEKQAFTKSGWEQSPAVSAAGS